MQQTKANNVECLLHNSFSTVAVGASELRKEHDTKVDRRSALQAPLPL